jgi:RNA polymerase primary sigma factor
MKTKTKSKVAKPKIKTSKYKLESNLPDKQEDLETPSEPRGYTSVGSCVSSYMSKIGNHKLLSREEEKVLGTKIRKGRKKDKSEAVACLVEHNLKLAASIATEYQHRGMDLEDLISEASIGLHKAAERFDPKYGSKFSTYACYWIKQSVLRSIHKKARTVRLPTHLIEKISKLRKVQENISVELGRDASKEELCSLTGNREDVIDRLLNVQSQTSHINQTDSEKIGENDGYDILKSIPDTSTLSPLDEVSKKSDWTTVSQLISDLSEREQNVLSMRFGLGGQKCLTLEEVGKKLKLSRERIRQIENSTISKLKKTLENLESFEYCPNK